ncbi:Cysteine proteinase inhibitor 5 [Striga hermonthica]|uniref:Cysteine proteinase inhibitor 5 n=1 Tax=Striga hermonthica TaxID=68872 RepID=A0A9N7MYT5_STRHE|nr:Cysteine proteinase inhibitor 5 [Striga hermonthica]
MLFFIPNIAISKHSSKPILGGWTKINDNDLNSKEVLGVANFAVNEHNKEEKTNLKFDKVIGGMKQVVTGVNYDLTIEATDKKRVAGSYITLVYVDIKNKETLISFNKIQQNQ